MKQMCKEEVGTPCTAGKATWRGRAGENWGITGEKSASKDGINLKHIPVRKLSELQTL